MSKPNPFTAPRRSPEPLSTGQHCMGWLLVLIPILGALSLSIATLQIPGHPPTTAGFLSQAGSSTTSNNTRVIHDTLDTFHRHGSAAAFLQQLGGTDASK